MTEINKQGVLDFGPDPDDGGSPGDDLGYPYADFTTVSGNCRQAAEQGDDKAQYQVAQSYHYGVSEVAKDLVQALVWYKASEARGNPDAGWNAANVSRRMSPSELAEAEFQIGSMYEQARGVPHDLEEAADWFRKAAVRGHAGAQLGLGTMHATGIGLVSDDVKAYAWLNVAAKQENEIAGELMLQVRERMTDAEFVAACLELGEMYLGGRAIPKDEHEALFWYRKAASEGIAEAEFAMGEIYRNGEGVSADDRQAFEWYRKAADHGLAQAQVEIGEMCLHGEGTPAKAVEGLAWLYVAAMQGSEDAELSKEYAEQRMADTEISRARSLSHEYNARISRRDSRPSRI